MFYRLAIATLLVCLAAPSVHSDDSQSEPPKVNVETLFSGLDRPCGIAIQPKTGDLFVSNTGAGQVIKFAASKPSAPTVVITGFAHESAAQPDVPWKISGPMGLAFVEQNLLAVGTGETKNGDQTIRIFELPTSDTADKPLQLKDAKQVLNQIETPKDSPPGAFNLYAIVVSESPVPAIFATVPGHNRRGWLLTAEVRKNQAVDKLRQLVPRNTDEISYAITVNPRGQVVVGDAGKVDQPKDSSLWFYSAKTGADLGKFRVALDDIVSVAYGPPPENGRLYAADYAAAQGANGGVFRLDTAITDGSVGVKVVRIASIEHPTAIAFGADQALYLTTFGDKPKSGKLIKITGDL